MPTLCNRGQVMFFDLGLSVALDLFHFALLTAGVSELSKGTQPVVGWLGC